MSVCLLGPAEFVYLGGGRYSSRSEQIMFGVRSQTAAKLRGRGEETCDWDPVSLQLSAEVLDPSHGLVATLEALLGLGYVMLGKPAKMVALRKDSFPFAAALWQVLRALAYLACHQTF